MDMNPLPSVGAADGPKELPYFKLKDNSTAELKLAAGELPCRELEDDSTVVITDRGILDLLDFYSGKTFARIKSAKPDAGDGLLVIGDIENVKDDVPIYTLYRGEKDGEFSLKTGNIMGVFTLRRGNDAVRLVIGSRFDDNEKQPFLCWMLERVLNVNLTDFISSSSSEFWTILLELLFWHKLGEASRVGLYRQYQKVEYNDLRFRGKFDVDRHIRLNMPLWANIAYSRREIVFDNPVNHLLRYAANIITSKWAKSRTNGVLSRNSDAREMLLAIETNTPSWTPDRLNAVLRDRTASGKITQPYYAEYYEELRVLARYIIRHMGADVYSGTAARNEHSINGIILDGSWLWEAYLASILERKSFIHAIPPNNPRQKGKDPIYAMSDEGNTQPRRSLYPDFRLPENGDDQKSLVVLDAKYKKGDAKGGISVRRQDMHQCLAYMLLTGAKVGGVVYPPRLRDDGNDEDEDEDRNNVGFWRINAPYPGLFWKSFTFSAWDEHDFTAVMTKNEQNFEEYLANIIARAQQRSGEASPMAVSGSASAEK